MTRLILAPAVSRLVGKLAPDMVDSENETQALLRLVSLGHEGAAARLLNLHRKRLKKMVSCRIDQEVAVRHDPSDVVQETILSAANRLQEYLKKQSVPFYAWLRRLAWLRLVDLHRQHLERGRGETPKADFRQGCVTPKCVSELARRFAQPSGSEESSPPASQEEGSQKESASPSSSDGTHKAAPSARKTKSQVQAALTKLEAGTRELLLLYYVEQLTVLEIAGVLEIEPAQVKLRHMRAIRRMRTLLDQQDDEPAH